MSRSGRARRSVPALVAALALGIAACGSDDVESGVDQGKEKVNQAAKDA